MKKKPAKKAKKLESLSQTHGKEENDFQPTTLAQIWGDDGLSKYGTLDEAEYIKNVNDMHFSDLRTHAADIGLIPIDDRELLTKRVISEFRRHVNEYTVPKNTAQNIDDLDERARKILEEGK
jgi:hypothetical protein